MGKINLTNFEDTLVNKIKELFIAQEQGGSTTNTVSTLLEKNFLDLILIRELEGMSTGADAGYWWDLFMSQEKIGSTTGLKMGQAAGQHGYVQFEPTALVGSVNWKPHYVGFTTDGLIYDGKEVNYL